MFAGMGREAKDFSAIIDLLAPGTLDG